MTQMQSAAVAKRGLMDIVEGKPFQAMMERSLPSIGLTPSRLTGIVATEFRKVPQLANCSPASFTRSVMACAELGLIPGGAHGHCWILPYSKEATFVLGYKGAVHLGWRSGLLANIQAEAVYERDIFDYEYGLGQKLIHKPHPEVSGRGELTHVWAAVWPKGADRPLFKVMTRSELDEFRDRYVRAKNGPWFEDGSHAWMCKKTALKQLLKLAPTSSELNLSFAHDDRGEMGMSPEIDITDVSEVVREDTAPPQDTEEPASVPPESAASDSAESAAGSNPEPDEKASSSQGDFEGF